jgi:glycosyltransferase involved in cell wall biosynthesis
LIFALRALDERAIMTIGVIVPAHNEERVIVKCLAHIHVAAKARALAGEPVLIVVVADDCTDQTQAIAQRCGARTIQINARNVGVSRHEGAQYCLHAGCRWLAFTDADTLVDENWLVAQLALNAETVCGTVTVSDWSGHPAAVREHHVRTYTDSDGHRHIHGANLGVSATAYRQAGGFPPMVAHEDVALVKSLERIGANIAWSAAPRVVTSARQDYRTPEGFGATLARGARQFGARFAPARAAT